MSTPTPQMQERIDAISSRLQKYAKRHETASVPADDLYQIAVEDILKNCSPTDNDTYMLRLADWRMKNAVKREIVYSVRIQNIDDSERDEDGEEFEIVDLTDTPEEFIIRAEMQAVIADIYSGLDDMSRSILGYMADGLNQHEIAREMKTSHPRIRYYVLKIRQAFQQAGISQIPMQA